MVLPTDPNAQNLPLPIYKVLNFNMAKVIGETNWWVPLMASSSGGLIVDAYVKNNVSIYNRLTRSDVRKIVVNEGLPGAYTLTSAEIDTLFDQDFDTGVVKDGVWKVYFNHPLRYWHVWVWSKNTGTGVETMTALPSGVKTNNVSYLATFALAVNNRLTEIYVEKIPDTNSDTCDGAGLPIGSDDWGVQWIGFTINKRGLSVNSALYGNDVDNGGFHPITSIESSRKTILDDIRQRYTALLVANKPFAEMDDCFYYPPGDLYLQTSTKAVQKTGHDVHTIESITFTQELLDILKTETTLFYPPNDDYAICVEGSEMFIHNDSDQAFFTAIVEFPVLGKIVKRATVGKALATLGGRVSINASYSKEIIVGCRGEPLSLRIIGSHTNGVFVKINYRFVRGEPCPAEYVGFTERPYDQEWVGFTERPYDQEWVGFTERPYDQEWVGFTERPLTDYLGFLEKEIPADLLGFLEKELPHETVAFDEKVESIP